MLTELKIKKTTPSTKPIKLKDGDGLFLLVHPNGSKYWRMRYYFNGKEKMLALGKYPQTSLADARAAKQSARQQLAAGIDPVQNKKAQKLFAKTQAKNTFEEVARQWHEKNQTKWQQSTSDAIIARLENHLFTEFGQRPIASIKPLEFLHQLQAIEKKSGYIARKVAQIAKSIYSYAIITGRAESNPVSDLTAALSPYRPKNYPTILAKDLPDFLRALAASPASPLVKLAIKLLLLTFVRQGELRRSKWVDVDFEAKQWNIPAHLMKMRRPHIVPLAPQAVAVFEQLKKLTGNSEYILPAVQKQRHPVMSENTINKALRAMGYKKRLVAHGFRALASTTLNEQGFKFEVIEKQLAHEQTNKVAAAYNRAEYLAEREKMMIHWANYVASLGEV